MRKKNVKKRRNCNVYFNTEVYCLEKYIKLHKNIMLEWIKNKYKLKIL